jgi:hypothetical protein
MPNESLLHFLPGLESGESLLWNWDRRASAGITASAGFADVDRKHLGQLGAAVALHDIRPPSHTSLSNEATTQAPSE